MKGNIIQIAPCSGWVAVFAAAGGEPTTEPVAAWALVQQHEGGTSVTGLCGARLESPQGLDDFCGFAPAAATADALKEVAAGRRPKWTHGGGR